MAVNIVESLVVLVGDVFIILLRLKLATKWELRISTVASKGCFAVKLKHFVTFVTDQHASKTESVRLYLFGKFLLGQVRSFFFGDLL